MTHQLIGEKKKGVSAGAVDEGEAGGGGAGVRSESYLGTEKVVGSNPNKKGEEKEGGGIGTLRRRGRERKGLEQRHDRKTQTARKSTT